MGHVNMSRVDEIVYNVVLAILSASVVVLCITLFLICRKRAGDESEASVTTTTTTTTTKLYARRYTLMEVDSATDGFNQSKIIGKGRLGIVYGGVLPGGVLVTVKRINPGFVLSRAGMGFSSMLKWLSLADHPHVASIIGYSEAPGERIIVMEYVGMSLEGYLHQNSGGASFLDWRWRLRIAAGVARGLVYLHEVMAPRIVHGCVKPSNILVDVNLRAKLCDYGLSFLALQDAEGVEGYVDDEYWVDESTGATKECDVYGVGVVLLELLCGRKSEGGLLVNWALPLIKDMKFSEFLDPRLVMPSDLKPVARLAKVASACVGNSRKNRPSIVQVAAILDNLEFNQ